MAYFEAWGPKITIKSKTGIFPSSITVQSFITIKLQAKKLSMIKILKFLVSGHLKCGKQNFSIRASFVETMKLIKCTDKYI